MKHTPLAIAAALSVLATSASAISVWEFTKEIDVMDDTNKSHVILWQDEEPFFLGNTPDAIVLRCDGKGGFDAAVMTLGSWGRSKKTINVMYRFGGEDFVNLPWPASPFGETVFQPTGYSKFTDDLLSGDYKTLAIRVRDARGKQRNSTFTNLKIDDNVRFVASGCSEDATR